MKSIQLLIILTVYATLTQAQSKKYIQTMEASIASLYQAETLTDYDPMANKFDRIGQAEGNQWEPYYYAALTHTFKAFKINDLQIKDAALDQALTALSKAGDLSENNSEIIALRGFVNMIKIGVDPATRGQSLSPKIMADFNQSLKLDPNNPRANLFMGQMLYGTAEFFGTGVDDACALVDQSIVLFESEKPASSIAPSWGKQSAYQYKKQCKAALVKTESQE
ncbi:hypothetical protein N7E81_17510 [Reichenbachiella carrageenanivorans]|uniref:Tetratricopeptide repeat-containing protein n=1 Tax=Reichenbachiella carrageenanivorans TaxID=2979869 RepID=A0ABY6D255_9BACT|nr:hypothetical protein [Reichenbachiella carrageenanivorans]UXX79153.1 hypothetical protein N7E81_17510 [Reichenbachiella carrageenanivorans]